jgi:hypothetical protein
VREDHLPFLADFLHPKRPLLANHFDLLPKFRPLPQLLDPLIKRVTRDFRQLTCPLKVGHKFKNYLHELHLRGRTVLSVFTGHLSAREAVRRLDADRDTV